MSSASIFRVATRTPHACTLSRHQKLGAARRSWFPTKGSTGIVNHQSGRVFSTSVKRSDAHGEETFEEFTARYEKEFDAVQDVFELQRNLNNAFAYDLVPSPSVCTAALRAARRVNDFPTAVRIFEGIKAKVENRGQYHEYLRDLQPLREELGVDLKEELYPEATYDWEKAKQ